MCESIYYAKILLSHATKYTTYFKNSNNCQNLILKFKKLRLNLAVKKIFNYFFLIITVTKKKSMLISLYKTTPKTLMHGSPTRQQRLLLPP